MSKFTRNLCIGIALALNTATPASAQDAYPSKPIRILVGYPPGSATATAARNYSIKLTERLGQSVIIENRPGASGTLAAEAVARAAPDGYTLLAGTPSELALNRPAGMQLRYDPEKDLVPIALLYTTTPVLIASVASGHKTLRDFVEAAKAKPGIVSIASVNVYQQVLLSTFEKASGIKLNVVYYKGTALALTDVLGGQIDALVGYPAEMSPHVQSGRVRGLALIGPQRNPFIPDTPIIAEAGFAMPDLMTWGGFFAPAGTSAAIIEKINRETIASGESPELKAAIAKTGSDVRPLTSRAFKEFIDAEIAKWDRLVKDSGVKIQ